MSNNRRLFVLLALLAGLVLALGVAACGGDDDDDGGGGDTSANLIEDNPDNNGVQVTVGSKNFTEQFILGEIYAQALEAAGYDVKTQLNLGSEQIALRALEDGEIDAYPEYTSTALTSFFDIPAEDVPADAQEATEETETQFEDLGLTVFEPTPFESANAVGLLTERAEELGVESISDLEGESQNLALYGSPECRQRVDCLVGLEDNYGLQFKKFTPVDIALRHEVLKRGDDVVSIVFTTDPQNKRENLVLLEDDKGMFPPYNSTFVVRDEVAQEAGGDLPKVVEQIQQGLTDEVMQELNARVDLDKKTPETVAGEYLSETGLVQ